MQAQIHARVVVHNCNKDWFEKGEGESRDDNDDDVCVVIRLCGFIGLHSALAG